jgi:hypothetical protein
VQEIKIYLYCAGDQNIFAQGLALEAMVGQDWLMLAVHECPRSLPKMFQFMNSITKLSLLLVLFTFHLAYAKEYRKTLTYLLRYACPSFKSDKLRD